MTSRLAARRPGYSVRFMRYPARQSRMSALYRASRMPRPTCCRGVPAAKKVMASRAAAVVTMRPVRARPVATASTASTAVL
jgi:hypothetical protein